MKMSEEKLEKRILLAHMNPEVVSHEIEDFIINQVLNSGATGGVIGLSGGVDSTATAALAKRAFDVYNHYNPNKPLELVGYILPSDTNNPEDAQDGIKVAEQLGIRYEVHSIDPLVQAYSLTNPEALKDSFHKGNIMSRIRGNILSTKAATERKSLVGTGNRDEDYGIGYYTLFGDGAVHMSPIGRLPKRLVREMAHYLGFNEIAEREPTAGLEPGQTDLKDLGYSYDIVELVIEGKDQGFKPEEIAGHNQIIKLANKEIVQYEKLFGSRKFNNAKGMVNDVMQRHDYIAVPKEKLLHPPMPKITLEYK